MPEYLPSDEQWDKIENSFVYHKPTDNQTGRFEQLRSEAKALAHLYYKLAPNSRELSLAITKLEESLMWVNKAIVINEMGDE